MKSKTTSTFFLVILISISFDLSAFSQQIPKGVAQFIPEKYCVLKAVNGNLNKDSISDWILILHRIGEDTIRRPSPKRPMLLILGQAGQTFKLAARNDSIVYTPDMGGISNDEPFGNVIIDKGSFSIQFWGAMGYYHWQNTLTFQYEAANKDWYLEKINLRASNVVFDDSGKVPASSSSESTRTAKAFGRISFEKFNSWKTYTDSVSTNQQPEYLDSGFTNKTEAKNITINGKKEGKWCEYLDTDHVLTTNTSAPYYSLTVYKKDNPFGISRGYYKSGQLYWETPYTGGKKNGVEKDYYASGKLEWEFHFINDTANGLNKEYYEDGKLKSKTQFTDGNGIEMDYDENGKLRSKITWYDGHIVSRKNYDKNGNEIKQ